VFTDLDPAFRTKAEMVCRKLDELGIKYAVTETRRPYAAQAAAFARGASKRDGLKLISLHQAGLAIDIVPLDAAGRPTWDYAKYAEDYKRIGSVSKADGLEWGGDWAPIDPKTGLGWDAPHHEFKG
jgi:hypothetical protein